MKLFVSQATILLLSIAAASTSAFLPAASSKGPQKQFAVQVSAEEDLELTRQVIAQFTGTGNSAIESTNEKSEASSLQYSYSTV